MCSDRIGGRETLEARAGGERGGFCIAGERACVAWAWPTVVSPGPGPLDLAANLGLARSRSRVLLVQEFSGVAGSRIYVRPPAIAIIWKLILSLINVQKLSSAGNYELLAETIMHCFKWVLISFHFLLSLIRKHLLLLWSYYTKSSLRLGLEGN